MSECHHNYEFEQIGGMLAYRIRERKKLYRACCSKCGSTIDVGLREVQKIIKSQAKAKNTTQHDSENRNGE